MYNVQGDALPTCSQTVRRRMGVLHSLVRASFRIRGSEQGCIRKPSFLDFGKCKNTRREEFWSHKPTYLLTCSNVGHR